MGEHKTIWRLMCSGDYESASYPLALFDKKPTVQHIYNILEKEYGFDIEAFEWVQDIEGQSKYKDKLWLYAESVHSHTEGKTKEWGIAGETYFMDTMDVIKVEDED